MPASTPRPAHRFTRRRGALEVAVKAAALLPLAGMAAKVRATPSLASTPLAGHFTHHSVRIWLQAIAPGRGRLVYWLASGYEEDARTVPLAFAADADCATILEIGGLQPASVYRYRVVLDDASGQARGPVGSFRTLPLPGAAPRDFRVYLGSCAYSETYTRGGSRYGGDFQIFDTMAGQMAADRLPHFMLWLGDNLYLRSASRNGAAADYERAEYMALRYRDVRARPMLQRLFAATHHYAIWDDHDYGPNNGNRDFALKDDSLRLFRAYWPNPDMADMGSAQVPGIATRFVHQDAEFFLLDNRFHRDDEKADPHAGKAMFGPAQMAWLKRSLRASTATFKLVAGGTQFLSENRNGVQSGWHSYPAERDDFLDWLARERIPGLVLLSGDRHNTQLFRHELPGAAPLHEFSCSPMTSRLIRLSQADRSNPRLEPECVVERHNYGTLEFSGPAGARRITARCHDADGELLWTRTLAAQTS